MSAFLMRCYPALFRCAPVLLMLTACFLVRPPILPAEEMSPVVSADWLAKNLGNSQLVVLDIRAAGPYNKGHIPGSLNTPLRLWAVTRNGLLLELPSDEELRDLLGESGIRSSSLVVVVPGTETDFSRADGTRVAWTLKVAGVEHVAVLDGGYGQWIKDGKAVSTDASAAVPSQYRGIMDRSSSISKTGVLGKIGKSIIVDARTPEDYFGMTSKQGHIKSAVDLPTPWAFTASGTYRDKQTLRAMAEGVVGADRSKEVILYCGVGGYASTWWFLLTQMLGYRNVKLYDGSMQEWVMDPGDPTSVYSWH